jgi:LPXTG-motif cell wall-anchored protein
MPNASRIRQGLAIAAVSLVLPAGASAQGAGDDQYSDPFGADATPTAAPKKQPAATATPAPAPAQPAATPAPATPAGTSTPAPAPPQLPYTGVDAWPLAAGGVLLLGAGLALRARVRD